MPEYRGSATLDRKSQNPPPSANLVQPYALADAPALVETTGDIILPYANFVCDPRTTYVGVAAVLTIVKT